MRSISGLFILFVALLCSTNCESAFAQEMPKNPVQNFFEKLDKDIKQGADEIEQAKLGRDQLDIRPVQRSEDQRRLKQAVTLIKSERWHDAIEILQYLLEQQPDAFLIETQREFRSVHAHVEELIGRLPEDGIRNYRNRFSAVATELLKTARIEQDEFILLEVSHRFLHTAAGQSALYDLINLWEDRGEFVAAAEGTLRLLLTSDRQSGRGNSRAKELSLRAVELLAQAGQSARARSLVTTLATQNTELDKQELLQAIDATSVIASQPQQAVTPYSNLSAEAVTNPVLIPQWNSPVVERFSVQEQIETLINDIGEQGNGRALVPTSQPMIVAGMIAYRSLHGLVLREPATGKVVWEQHVTNSPEEQLTAQTFGREQLPPGRSKIAPYSSQFMEHHALPSLLYRDSIYGCLSSSGTNLYSVEGGALIEAQRLGYSWRTRRNNVDTAERERLSSNELVAYNLDDVTQIRSPRWVLGGPRIEEQFSRRLAGTFFFGPPVADGAELFVIGEQDEEISLFCLSARTGDVLWSQMLASPGRGISEDIVRRYWHCLPLIQDGLVICPTNCGWLVAVDRQTRQLRWTTRYSPRKKRPQRFRGGFDVQNIQSLNVRWGSSIPMAVNGRILFTPQEFPDEFGTKPMLICVDQQSGKEVWSYGKADGLYLAGLYEEQAIVVTSNSVQSRRVTGTGGVDWSCELPSGNGEPSGRGVITGELFTLPVGERTLVTIDLKTGKVTETRTLMESVPSLGNLLANEGTLYSLSPLNLLCFQSEATARQLAANGLSPFNLCINTVEKLRSEGKHAAALQALRKFRTQTNSESLSRKEQTILDEIEWDILVEKISLAPDQSQQQLLRLRKLAVTPARVDELARLNAELNRNHGDWRSALEQYLALLETTDERWVQEDNREVRQDRWVSGRMADMFASLNEEEQSAFNDIVRTSFAQKTPIQAADLLPFTTVGQEFELLTARSAREQGDIGVATFLLQRVTESTSMKLKAEAWAELGFIYLEKQYFQDAQAAFEQLAKLSDLEIKNGELASVVAKAGLETCQQQIAAQPVREEKSWGDHWQVAQHSSRSSRYQYSSSNRNALMMVEPSGTTLAALASKSFQFEYSGKRLNIEDAEDGSLYWNFPLMTFEPVQQHQTVGISLIGPLGVVLHRGVLHAMDLTERKLLWTYSPQLTGVAASRLRYASAPNDTRMRSPASIVSATRPDTTRSTNGYLLAAGPRCLLILHRDLIALDPLNGDVLWREKNVSTRTVAHYFQKNFMIMGNGAEHVLVRAIDGAVVKQKPLGDFSSDCIFWKDDQLVLLKPTAQTGNSEEPEKNPPPRTRDGSQDYVVRGVSIDGEREFWSHTIPGDSLLSREDERLLWITRTGEFVSLNLHSGLLKVLGAVPEELAKIKKFYYLISDDQQDYVVVAHGQGRVPHVNMSSKISARGTLIAFDRNGGVLWSRKTTELGPEIPADQPADGEPANKEAGAEDENVWPLVLVAQEFDRSPLLVFVGDQSVHQDGLHYRRLRLACLDKRTGDIKLRWERPSDSGGFSRFHVDLKRRFLSLQTYNQELVIEESAVGETE